MNFKYLKSMICKYFGIWIWMQMIHGWDRLIWGKLIYPDDNFQKKFQSDIDTWSDIVRRCLLFRQQFPDNFDLTFYINKNEWLPSSTWQMAPQSVKGPIERNVKKKIVWYYEIIWGILITIHEHLHFARNSFLVVDIWWKCYWKFTLSVMLGGRPSVK